MTLQQGCVFALTSIGCLFCYQGSPSDSYSIRHTVSYPDPTDVSIITSGNATYSESGKMVKHFSD